MPVLTEEPIAPERLIARVAAADRGGIALFLGAVRDHHGDRAVTRLEYSAYGPMAERECEAIVAEAESRWPAAIAVAHRIGALAVGETAVGVAAAAAHRDAAFDACRYVIEELKRRVPIWKKEFYADGTVAWVDPTAPAGALPVEGVDA